MLSTLSDLTPTEISMKRSSENLTEQPPRRLANSEVEESEAFTKYVHLLRHDSQEDHRREREAFRRLARDPTSRDYLDFVKQLELWERSDHRIRLLRLDTKELPVMSPLNQCDLIGTLIKHLTAIDHPTVGYVQVDANDYLLSARVIKIFLKSAKHTTPSDFVTAVCTLIEVALRDARPGNLHLSMNGLHDLDELDTFCVFLQSMCLTARLQDHTEEGPLKLRIETHQIGQAALELILHWLDLIWGFASRSPVYEQFKYQDLGAVTRDMMALIERSKPLTTPPLSPRSVHRE